MKNLIVGMWLLLAGGGLFVQKELMSVADPLAGLNSILGGSTNAKVTVISESEQGASVRVEFKGFQEKRYIFKIQVRTFQADPIGLSKVQMPTITVKSENTSVSPNLFSL